MPTSEPLLHADERILIALPDRDSPPKRDHKSVFAPESKTLARVFGPTQTTVVQIEVPVVEPGSLTIASAKKQAGFERAAAALTSAVAAGNFTRVVLMCHGWATGIQLGLRSSGHKGNDAANFAAFVAALKRQPDLRSITLFACSAGDEPSSKESSPGTGEASFADALRDAVGRPVIAHWSAGHATRNPDLIVFEANDAPQLGGIVPLRRGTTAYRNGHRLLTARKPKAGGVASGDKPPAGHLRPAWTNLVLVGSASGLLSLLSSTPT